MAGFKPNGALDILSSANKGTARLRVDVSQTGFWEGREFRISVPLSIPAATPVVLKFVAPINFILESQGLTCDEQGILFQAYRSTQGTEGGSFSTEVPIYSNNFQSTSPTYAHQATITTGGTFTPDGGQQSVETVRVKTAGSTAQAVTVGGSVRGERGLAAGAYYLKFSNLTGSGTAQGVYSLIFEERP
jgi:hypothetical protein